MNELLTLKEIAADLGVPLGRIRHISNYSGVKPSRWVGPTALYSEAQKAEFQERVDAMAARRRTLLTS